MLGRFKKKRGDCNSILKTQNDTIESKISKILENEQLLDELGKDIKIITDGEPKNANPLTEIPRPQKRIYAYEIPFGVTRFFDTRDELVDYARKQASTYEWLMSPSLYILDYLGTMAGRPDVIRKTSSNGVRKFITSVDYDGYGAYNEVRSTYKGSYVWEYCYGSLREICDAFKERGITFENDVYAKMDELFAGIDEIVDHAIEERKGHRI